MKIFVNSQPQEIPDGSNVSTLASIFQLSEQGVALAINNQMIPRTEWGDTKLQPDDKVIIIKAACGG